MKKKMTGGINVGTSSILVTFVLLCLVTFAALSFLSANSDYNLSRQSAERTTQYYAANSAAEYLLADIEGRLAKARTDAVSEDAFMDSIPKLFNDNDSIVVEKHASDDSSSDNSPSDGSTSVELSKLAGLTTLSYDVPVNDTQNLHVIISVNYPTSDDSALFHIMEWKTETADIWEEDDSNATLLDDGDIGFMTFE